MRLVPPPEPIADARGNVSLAWLSYLQALADRLAALEARLPAPPAAP